MRSIITVIIPCYNREPWLAETLAALLCSVSRSGPAEVIVADDASTDGSADTAQRLGARVVSGIPGRRQTLAALRNAGASAAAGDVFCFLDADMTVLPDFLACARKRFEGGFLGLLGFVFQVPPEAGWVGRLWGDRWRGRRPVEMDVDFLPGCNVFVNRHIFEQVAGFREDLTTGEDKDFALRVRGAGYRVVSATEARVLHRGYERNLVEFIRKEFWRQGASLGFLRRGGSFRVWRNPALSAWHLICPAVALVCAFAGAPWGVWSGVAGWLGPAAVLALRECGLARLRDLPALAFLIWLRWTVAGIALVCQLAGRGSRAHD